MRPFDPSQNTRRFMQIGLVVAGAVAGAVFGLVLTRLGKLATGAPPAPLANYVWNAAVFGALAAVVSPVITWSALRRVPLWRTVAEPLGAAVAGGCGAVILGVPGLLLVLPPLGLGLGFANLRRRYPDAFEGNTLAASLDMPRVRSAERPVSAPELRSA